MIVNIYTSRVVLEALGVDDYGVYNTVAGFIAMFSIVSHSISGAISRYLTFELGKGDGKRLSEVFSTSLIIQIILAVIVTILVEVFGVWFLNHKMTIPEGRLAAANWVLQLAMVTFIVNLWSVPYNAVIIAHEKMNAFAFIGIFEGCANLGIAFLLSLSPFDRLVTYAILMSLVSVIVRSMYSIYCTRHFRECKFQLYFDKSLFKEMFSFSGWNFIGATSGLLRSQGINLLFNIYFGPVLNAAYGLAAQVQNAVCQFSNNFYTAVKPQITKSYAVKETDESNALVIRSGRLAFILLMFLVIPIVSEADFLINIWLKEVPEHTVSFVRIILLFSMLESFSLPMITLMLATGNVKRYQIVVGSVCLLNFPAAWLVLILGGSSEVSLVTIIIFSAIALVFRLKMLSKMTNFPVGDFLKESLSRCLLMFLICIVPSAIIVSLMPQSIVRFAINLVASELTIAAVAFTIGLTKNEKVILINKVKSVFGRAN